MFIQEQAYNLIYIDDDANFRILNNVRYKTTDKNKHIFEGEGVFYRLDVDTVSILAENYLTVEGLIKLLSKCKQDAAVQFEVSVPYTDSIYVSSYGHTDGVKVIGSDDDVVTICVDNLVEQEP